MERKCGDIHQHSKHTCPCSLYQEFQCWDFLLSTSLHKFSSYMGKDVACNKKSKWKKQHKLLLTKSHKEDIYTCDEIPFCNISFFGCWVFFAWISFSLGVFHALLQGTNGIAEWKWQTNRECLVFEFQKPGSWYLEVCEVSKRNLSICPHR